MSRPLSSHAEPGRHRSSPTEAIPSGQLWPKSFLHSKLGWGSAAYCNARRAGLPTYEYARQQWVWTDDLIAFLLDANAKDWHHQSARRTRLESGRDSVHRRGMKCLNRFPRRFPTWYAVWHPPAWYGVLRSFGTPAVNPLGRTSTALPQVIVSN